jgi:hypothetical protein
MMNRRLLLLLGLLPLPVGRIAGSGDRTASSGRETRPIRGVYAGRRQEMKGECQLNANEARGTKPPEEQTKGKHKPGSSAHR